MILVFTNSRFLSDFIPEFPEHLQLVIMSATTGYSYDKLPQKLLLRIVNPLPLEQRIQLRLVSSHWLDTIESDLAKETSLTVRMIGSKRTAENGEVRDEVGKVRAPDDDNSLVVDTSRNPYNFSKLSSILELLPGIRELTVEVSGRRDAFLVQRLLCHYEDQLKSLVLYNFTREQLAKIFCLYDTSLPRLTNLQIYPNAQSVSSTGFSKFKMLPEKPSLQKIKHFTYIDHGGSKSEENQLADLFMENLTSKCKALTLLARDCPWRFPTLTASVKHITLLDGNYRHILGLCQKFHLLKSVEFHAHGRIVSFSNPSLCYTEFLLILSSFYSCLTKTSSRN